MHTGVVIFDATHYASEVIAGRGWVSINGEPAMHFDSPTELPSGVVYWTNLLWHELVVCNLAKNPFFLRTDYFGGSTMQNIGKEIGACPSLMAAQDIAEQLSGLFARVMTLLNQQYAINPVESPTAKLGDYFAKRYRKNVEMDEHFRLALLRSYQERNEVVQSRLRQTHHTLSIRLNRFAHAMNILSVPTPDIHDWHHISQCDLPKDHLERTAWCIGSDMPILANVTVKPTRSKAASLLSYGGGVGYTRNWVTQPELLWISRIASVTIHSVFRSGGGFVRHPEIDLFPEVGDFSYASTSLGLIAESFWQGLSSPAISENDDPAITPRHAWWRAVDRLLCFAEASKLSSSKGWDVLSYGNGEITLRYQPEFLPELSAVCAARNLQMPAEAHRQASNAASLAAHQTEVAAA